MSTGPRTIVVTGGSDGIGAEAARALRGPDVRLVVVGRSPEKTRRVAESLRAEAFTVDFADLDDVRRLGADLAATLDRVDVLVNNAGGTFTPDRVTAQGHEPNLQVNHLAGFLLTHLLREQLVAGSARVVNTSSVAHLLGTVRPDDLDHYRGRTSTAAELRAYGASKQMNVLFARALSRRWGSDGVTACAVHPGAVASSFGRDSALVGVVYRTPLSRVLAITSQQGSEPLVRLADAPDELVDGAYFHRFRKERPSRGVTRDEGLADALWDASRELTGL